MFFQIQENLSLYPYSACFFYSYVNQEFIDDKVPNLLHLRSCLQNIKIFDFNMIHDESYHFAKLFQEVL